MQQVILDTNIFIEYIRKKNKAVEIRDLFIAGIVLENDIELATDNQQHFINFP